MTPTNYDTDPGLRWSPTLRPPKHPAVAVYVAAEKQWRWECPCGEVGPLGDHDAAMSDSMNHRSSHRMNVPLPRQTAERRSNRIGYGWILLASTPGPARPPRRRRWSEQIARRPARTAQAREHLPTTDRG